MHYLTLMVGRNQSLFIGTQQQVADRLSHQQPESKPVWPGHEHTLTALVRNSNWIAITCWEVSFYDSYIRCKDCSAFKHFMVYSSNWLQFSNWFQFPIPSCVTCLFHPITPGCFIVQDKIVRPSMSTVFSKRTLHPTVGISIKSCLKSVHKWEFKKKNFNNVVSPWVLDNAFNKFIIINAFKWGTCSQNMPWIRCI